MAKIEQLANEPEQENGKNVQAETSKDATEASSTGKADNIGKQIALTAIKTICCCIFALVVIVLATYAISPAFMAKICNNMGFKNAEISCLELVCARNKTDANLYNLILKLGANGNYTKQNEYILKLQESSTYTKFCNNLDSATINSYSSGSLSATNLCYTYGANEYLSSRYVLNLLTLGKLQEAYSAATSYYNADVQNSTDVVLYYYAEYLLTSSISSSDRTTYFAKLLQEDNFSLLQTKLDALAEQAENLTGGLKIINAYSQMKLAYVIYVANNYGGNNDANIDNLQAAYTSARAAWLQLI